MKKPAFDPRLKMKSFVADLDQSFKAGLEKIRIDPESINFRWGSSEFKFFQEIIPIYKLIA